MVSATSSVQFNGSTERALKVQRADLFAFANIVQFNGSTERALKDTSNAATQSGRSVQFNGSTERALKEDNQAMRNALVAAFNSTAQQREH